MSADPILVLQTQRLGDLILTFPALLALQRRWPDAPIWVAGEPQFFQPLMPLAPTCVFFPSSHVAMLARRSYTAVCNLGSLPAAARCAAQAEAPLKFGPLDHGQGLRVSGYWQLYRAALTQNNRHNAFHWADLHRLDFAPPDAAVFSGRKPPRAAGHGRVGLVLGASEAAKRPDARFWARLAIRLAAAGITPLFLGGQAERELGEEVSRLSRLPRANVCGKLSLGQLADLLRELDLCITPDTGPMHLADWLGVPVLNLSLGPVHARETGPVSPGQWILRAAMSCSGCWQCRRPQLKCKAVMTAPEVARCALALLEGIRSPGAMPRIPRPARLSLLRTGRDALGLHTLGPQHGEHLPSCRPLLEDFWQAVFLRFQHEEHAPLARARLERLARTHPALPPRLATGLARLIAACSLAFRRQERALPDGFWRAGAPMLRLFAGHTHMFLQNGDFAPQAWRTALQRMDVLRQLLDAAR